MKKYIFLAAVALGAVALASCSNNEAETNANPEQPAELNELRLSSGLDVVQTGNTRGAASQDGQFDQGAYFDTFILENATTPTVTYGTGGRLFTCTTSADGQTEFVEAANSTTKSIQYWPSTGNGVNIYAWYPQGAAGTDVAATAVSFSVNADQTAAANYKASDLMFGVPSANNPVTRANQTAEFTGSTAKYVPLQFSHKLSRINIVLVPGDGLSPSALLGTEVSLVNVINNCSLNVKTGEVTVGTTKGNISVMKVADSFATSETPTSAEPELSADNSAIVIPQDPNPTGTSSGSEAKIKVKLSNNAELFYTLINSTDVWEAGKQYTYTITVKLTEILVSSTITPWGNAVERTGDAVIE